jgi:hypothetical protein
MKMSGSESVALKMARKLTAMVKNGATSEELKKALRESFKGGASVSVTLSVGGAPDNSKLLKKNIDEKENDIICSISACGDDTSADSAVAKKNMTELIRKLKEYNAPFTMEMRGDRYVMRWSDVEKSSGSQFSINPVDGSFSVSIASGTLKINGVVLTMKDDQLLWNGSETPPSSSRISVVDCPDLKVIASDDSSVLMVAKSDYLVETNSGLFKLKTLPPERSPGLIMNASLTSVNKHSVRLKLKLILNVISGRKPLPGTNLKVGEPLIMSNTFNQTLTAALGDWIMTCGYSITEKVNKQRTQLYLIQRVVKENRK